MHIAILLHIICLNIQSNILYTCCGTTLHFAILLETNLRFFFCVCVQSRFKVDMVYKDYLLMIIGQRWKESKSRLVAAIKKASQNPDSTDTLASLKPFNIKSDDEWNAFVTEKLSEKFEVVIFVLLSLTVKYITFSYIIFTELIL